MPPPPGLIYVFKINCGHGLVSAFSRCLARKRYSFPEAMAVEMEAYRWVGRWVSRRERERKGDS